MNWRWMTFRATSTGCSGAAGESFWVLSPNAIEPVLYFRTYLDIYHVLGDQTTKIANSLLDLSAAEYQLYGGKLEKTLDECTHVVVHNK